MEQSKMIRLILEPPVSNSFEEKTQFEVKQSLYIDLYSYYKDYWNEGEFSDVWGYRIPLIKAIWGYYKSISAERVTFNLGITGSRNKTELYLECPIVHKEKIKAQLKSNYVGIVINEVESMQFDYNQKYIVFGDWRDRLKTFKDDQSDPVEAMIHKLSSINDDEVVQVEYQITPISWYYNCIANESLNKASATDTQSNAKVQSVEASKSEQGRSAMFQLGITVSTNKGESDIYTLVQSAWGQVALPTGNKIIEGEVINHHKYQSVVSEHELWGLWHITDAGYKNREVLTKPLKYPAALYGAEDKFAVTIGYSNHPSSMGKPIGIYSFEELKHHICIRGVSGSGKSELIKNIGGDIAHNMRDVALTVVDPKANLGGSFLSRIPEDRLQDVVYLQPAKTIIPMSFFDLSDDLETMSSLFIEIIQAASNENIAGSSGDMLQSKLYGFFEVLKSVMEIGGVNNKMSIRYLNKVINQIYVNKQVFRSLRADSRISDKGRILIEQILKTPDSRLDEKFATPENKIHKFIPYDKLAKNIDNYNAKLNFEDCLRDKKIVIIDMSGYGGGKQAYIATLFYIKKLFNAINKQAKVKPEEVHKHCLILDEASDVTSKLQAETKYALSKYRSHGTAMILANQYTDQLPELVKGELSNVKTDIYLQTKEENDINAISRMAGVEDMSMARYIYHLKKGSGYMNTLFNGQLTSLTTFDSPLKSDKGWEERYEYVTKNTYNKYFVEDCDVSFSVNDFTGGIVIPVVLPNRKNVIKKIPERKNPVKKVQIKNLKENEL